MGWNWAVGTLDPSVQHICFKLMDPNVAILGGGIKCPHFLNEEIKIQGSLRVLQVDYRRWM